MVEISCSKEQRQDILDWLIKTDSEMFGDVVRCGFDPAANGHPGIFSFKQRPTSIIADSGKEEFFYQGHAMSWELKQFYTELKKQFPQVGLNGIVKVSDKYDEEFGVKAEPGSTDIKITVYDSWD